MFIQDYHLALVAPALRALRPDTRTALFWHIPWPYPDRLRICPWRRELVAGLLANDLIAFQLERDRRNFLMAAEEELDAEVELESSRVRFERALQHRGRRCRSAWTTTAFRGSPPTPPLRQEQQRLRELLDLRADIIGLGVDRLDYTKGIPERLDALDALMTRRPELRGKLTFVQIGVPSRSDLESYAAIEAEIGQRDRGRSTRATPCPGGAPVVTYYTTPLGAFSLVALYRLAHFCIVSSLHDGMNLVAKEFVAARDDEHGVLVLSALAGAAQELEDAVIINPYDVDAFAGRPRAGHRHDAPTSRRRACGRCGRWWPAGTSSTGRPTSSKASRASGPSRCSIRCEGWEETSV